MRKLLFLALILVACEDDDTGTGGGGTTASSTTGMTIGPPSLEATITCGGQPLQLSCPGPTTTLSTTIGSDGTTTAYCVANDMVTSINVAIPDPAVGNLRDLAKKYFVAINCPDGSVQSISELGGGYVIVESIDPGVQVKGSFASDAGDASGTFLAVASQQ